MYEAILILIAVAAFFLGFYLGNISKPKIKCGPKAQKCQSAILEKEYENFLNYNGEQQ